MTKSNFYLVELEDGVRLVSKNWLSKNKKCCRFPQEYDAVKYKKALRTEEPARTNWRLYRVLRVLGEAALDTYEETQKKDRRSLNSSDFDESTDLERGNSRKRNAASDELFDFEDFLEQTPSKRFLLHPSKEPTPVSSPSNDNTGEIVHLLQKIQKELETVKENQRLILEKVEKIENDLSKTEEEEIPLNYKLPLVCEEDLLSLESSMKDESFRKKFVLQLRNFGGRNVVHVIGYMMQNLMPPEVAIQYSYYGTKDKLQFSKLKICESIFAVTRFHHPHVTDQEIKTVIQNWLRHSKERLAKKLTKIITDDICI